MQIVLLVAVAGSATYSVARSHWLMGEQTRSENAVASAERKVLEGHVVEAAVHTRSLVMVGATTWYSVGAQTVSTLQMASE